jgi:hypothetical protein
MDSGSDTTAASIAWSELDALCHQNKHDSGRGETMRDLRAAKILSHRRKSGICAGEQVAMSTGGPSIMRSNTAR